MGVGGTTLEIVERDTGELRDVGVGGTLEIGERDTGERREGGGVKDEANWSESNSARTRKDEERGITCV